jgi:hypothetical protein
MLTIGSFMELLAQAPEPREYTMVTITAILENDVTGRDLGASPGR